MLFISQKSQNQVKVGIKQIADAIHAPEPFIAKILQELSRKGMVLSAKGPNGGFYLDEPGMKNTLADIVFAIDGNQLFTGCGLGLKTCSEKKPCPIHNQFSVIRKEIKKMLQSAVLEDFNASLEIGERFLKR